MNNHCRNRSVSAVCLFLIHLLRLSIICRFGRLLEHPAEYSSFFLTQTEPTHSWSNAVCFHFWDQPNSGPFVGCSFSTSGLFTLLFSDRLSLLSDSSRLALKLSWNTRTVWIKICDKYQFIWPSLNLLLLPLVLTDNITEASPVAAETCPLCL